MFILAISYCFVCVLFNAVNFERMSQISRQQLQQYVQRIACKIYIQFCPKSITEIPSSPPLDFLQVPAVPMKTVTLPS